MANQVQFEAHLRIVPERGSGKRFEIQREYFSALCSAKGVLLESPAAAPPAGEILEPGTVVKAIEATRAMKQDADAQDTQKIG